MGETIHIGIADTLGSPPDHILAEHNIREIHDGYLQTDKNDPIGHGSTVFTIALPFAPKAEYSTFQVIGLREIDGEMKPRGNRGDLIDAVNKAADAGVDILNLSLGLEHECHGLCSLSREIELAAEINEMCVVAATGNKDDSKKRIGVNCPAMLDAVLSVAGYMPFCGHEEIDEDSSQWWLKRDGELFGPFCGQRGCCMGEGCDRNRYEKLWDGNVSFHNAAPDVLAPVLEVSGDSLDKIHIQLGTSFSAPIVTGLLAGMLSDLWAAGLYPNHRDIRNAVLRGGVDIEQGGYHKMDCQRTWEILVDTHA